MFFDPDFAEDEEADRNLQRGLSEGSPEVLKAFALLAVLIQAALLGVSLGAMLLVFRGQRVVGGALVVGGLVGLGVAVVVYRRVKRRTGA
jgi:F0F1-type ATP synthase assembly protein I